MNMRLRFLIKALMNECRLTSGTTAEQVDQKENHGDNEQQMNKIADDIKDKAEQP